MPVVFISIPSEELRATVMSAAILFYWIPNSACFGLLMHICFLLCFLFIINFFCQVLFNLWLPLGYSRPWRTVTMLSCALEVYLLLTYHLTVYTVHGNPKTRRGAKLQESGNVFSLTSQDALPVTQAVLSHPSHIFWDLLGVIPHLIGEIQQLNHRSQQPFATRSASKCIKIDWSPRLIAGVYSWFATKFDRQGVPLSRSSNREWTVSQTFVCSWYKSRALEQNFNLNS